MMFNVNKRTAMYAGVAALAAMVGAGVSWQRRADDAIAPEVLDAFWAAEFDTPAGASLAMKTFQGHPLVINFWATWCTPCVEEMPLIDDFFRQNESKGWRVIGLAIDQPSRVRQFLTQFPVTYAIGLAGLTGTTMSKLFGNEVGGLPFTVVLDSQGQLIQRKAGKLTEDEIKNWVV